MALALVASGCRVGDPTVEQLPELAMFSNAQPTQTYAYGPNESHRIDLYRPSVLFGIEPKPAIVFVHGGAWVAGDQSFVDPIVKSQIRRGWAVLSANYRLAYDAPWPAQAHDIDRMMRWIRANAEQLGIDPNMIVLSGHSAGGHLALMNGLGSGAFVDPDLPLDLRTFSPRPQAIVAISAPTDLAALDFVLFGTVAAEVVNTLLGCPPPPTNALPTITCPSVVVRTASPLAYASADDPPVYIAHGDLDNIVDKRQAQRLHRRLRAVGRDEQTWLDIIDYSLAGDIRLSLPDRDRGHHPSFKINLASLELFMDEVRAGLLR